MLVPTHEEKLVSGFSLSLSPRWTILYLPLKMTPSRHLHSTCSVYRRQTLESVCILPHSSRISPAVGCAITECLLSSGHLTLIVLKCLSDTIPHISAYYAYNQHLIHNEMSKKPSTKDWCGFMSWSLSSRSPALLGSNKWTEEDNCVFFWTSLLPFIIGVWRACVFLLEIIEIDMFNNVMRER